MLSALRSPSMGGGRGDRYHANSVNGFVEEYNSDEQ